MSIPAPEHNPQLLAAAIAPREGVLKKILRDPFGSGGIVVIVVIVLLSVFAKLLAPFDPAYVDIQATNMPPFTDGHPLGTDASGRDVLSRLLVAGQLTLIGAAVTVVISLVIGVVTGLVAGYFAGPFDHAASWTADMLMVLPSKIVLVALFAVIGPNTVVTMAVLGVMVSPGIFRLVRSLVIGVKNELYVDAARVAGLSSRAIIGRHILYTVRAPIIIQAAFIAGIAVLIQAGLEFIGLGDPSTPTWGGMLQEAFLAMYKAPWLILWPGLMIGLFVSAFILLGNAVRDAMEDSAKVKVPKKDRLRTSTMAVTVQPGRRAANTPAIASGSALLVVDSLVVGYPLPDGELKRVVDGVSLSVNEGEVLGLVGESGSGKTQTAFAILGLLPEEAQIAGGALFFRGEDLIGMPEKARVKLRGKSIAYIPQEPMSNLDPAFRVGFQLVEPMRAQLGLSKSEATKQALELLARVGIPDPKRTFDAYPHQISGGMAQRVLIAGAISCNPDLLIADEPTTALDVTVQAEILDILRGLQKERNMAMVLVTHNFGVVADLCDTVAVMQLGRIVEQNSTAALFAAPVHPYTKMLLDSTLEGTPARAPLRRAESPVRVITTEDDRPREEALNVSRSV
ncbi:dipeptide/oligopeptide/nickel ABC transporter permease/ATP-binding protein [Microterricola pindariensis]|uniref:ABC transporter n=1 Tax=Microterricola pindariensis TaxID=478010 RepID=A0ABX5AZQ0_9MICO|nr:dipeptide/oligopeptide/nickel ABC transporter permease/ATP-binding protein [Microterricola pindariensis]PPL20397.1 ABC transporter [Microterricola pindariensis]